MVTIIALLVYGPVHNVENYQPSHQKEDRDRCGKAFGEIAKHYPHDYCCEKTQNCHRPFDYYCHDAFLGAFDSRPLEPGNSSTAIVLDRALAKTARFSDALTINKV